MTKASTFLLLAFSQLHAADWNGYQKTEFTVEVREQVVIATRFGFAEGDSQKGLDSRPERIRSLLRGCWLRSRGSFRFP